MYPNTWNKAPWGTSARASLPCPATGPTQLLRHPAQPRVLQEALDALIPRTSILSPSVTRSTAHRPHCLGMIPALCLEQLRVSIRQCLVRTCIQVCKPRTWGPGLSRSSFHHSSRILPHPHLSSSAPHSSPSPRAGRFPTPLPPMGPSADPRPLPPQSLLFLGLVAAVGLGLNLVFLAAYLVCVCCSLQSSAVQTKHRHPCCITWMAVAAGLVCW